MTCAMWINSRVWCGIISFPLNLTVLLAIYVRDSKQTNPSTVSIY